MASTYVSLYCHIVFATKHRQPWITEEWRSRLHEYFGGTLRGLNARPIVVGGSTDHVHILVGLKATQSVSDLVRETKKASSLWVKDQISLSPFAWQEGYAVFSVGADGLPNLEAYVRNQEEHHRKGNSLQELIHMLKVAGISYDPAYLD